MIDFGVGLLEWTTATLVPAFVGLWVITWVSKRIQPVYLTSFGFGIFLWFFADTIGGSGLAAGGFGGGLSQLGLLVLFLTGILLFFWIERKRGLFSPESAIGKYGLAIPLLVAIAVGIHGLAEGVPVGGLASTTSSTSLLDAIGGPTSILCGFPNLSASQCAGVAYVLHKGLEAMMIGACYSFYLSNPTARTATWLRNSVLLSITFVIPSLVGFATGYAWAYDNTYAFALGTGTSIYALARLAGPTFAKENTAKAREPMRLIVAWMLGFILIYFAALFHS